VRSKSLLDPSRILLAVIGVLALTVVVYLFLQVKTNRMKDSLDAGKTLAVLLLVTQEKVPLFNEILLYNPSTRKTALVDIPPQTGSLLPELGRVDAVSALYHPEDLKPYVAKLESLSGLVIPFQLQIDSQDLVSQVDLLSGIDVFVPKAVELTKTDPMTLLPSGNNLLDGAKANDFLLYSDEGEEMSDRIARYQKFVQSLLRRWGETKDFLLRDEVFPLFFHTLRTNLEEASVKTLVTLASTADWEQVVSQRVLGTERMVDGKRLLFPHYNGTLLKETVHQVEENLGTANSGQLVNSTLTVEVLNGTKLMGLATRTANLLRNQRYEVISAKNADNANQDKTTIIDRTGNPEMAQKLADLIRCKRIVVQSDAPEGAAKITIILGKDFDGRYVQ
jgi:anionic cell wall polymer biosynthesis LytR-Cps2A-Psr (LCP) family protein